MKRGFWFLLVFIFLACTSTAYAQADTATGDNAQFVKMAMNVVHAQGGSLFEQNNKFLSDSLIAQKVPQEVIDEVMGKGETKQFDEIAVKVLSKHFTVEQAKAINDFYESPTGKKLMQAMPLFMAEYFQQFFEISHKIYEDIFTKIEKKGYNVDNLRKILLNPVGLSAEMISPSTQVK